MKTFLKKNGFFVFLLTVILLIIISLSVYIFVKNRPEAEIPVEHNKPSDKPTTQIKETKITNLEGEYTQSTGNMKINWSYTQEGSKVKDAELYLNDGYIDTVTAFSYYDLSKSAYGYPTGNNIVKLVLNLEDGKKVEKTTTVFVDYLISMKQNVKQTSNSTKISLEYVYEKAHPVNIPEITTDGRANPVDIRYLKTTVKEEDGTMTAETTYEFFWEEVPVQYEQFGVRWKFNDIKESRDFEVEKGEAPAY